MQVLSTEKRCVSSINNRTCQLASNEQFTFDYIASETTAQASIFEEVGRHIIDQCLMGYNGSIFAYG